MSKSKTDMPGIMVLDDAAPRVVTPENPLIINYTPAVFADVEIKGGSIFTKIKTDVNITKLTKTS